MKIIANGGQVTAKIPKGNLKEIVGILARFRY
jgi:hypothetical protein